MTRRLQNRNEAGQWLATQLRAYGNHPEALVLALPRGGVPVGFEVATQLNVPLDICLVRKLGVPGHKELAMGAIATGGVMLRNEAVVQELKIAEAAIERVAASEWQELARRERLYRGNRPVPNVRDRRLLLVDDGIATGATLRAAIASLRPQQPKAIVVAVPVAPPSVCEELKQEADEVVCLLTPTPFNAIGLWYEDFSQTTDAEVRNLLDAANRQVKHVV
jgi:putative phosphoribosyl transferase